MKLRRLALRLGIMLVTATAVPTIAFEAAVRWWPYPDSLFDRPPSATWIVDRHHLPLATLVASDGSLHRWLNGDELGPYLADAVVAVEDERFFQHGAIDWRSMIGAAIGDVHAVIGGSHARRGASTITMQVARLREDETHSILGKIIQTIRATQIERRESKQSILIDYINRAPFGGNLVGAAAASWRYFGKPPAALSLSQAALLAGLPQSPNGDRPDRYPQRAKARRDHVLRRMLACGSIDAAQFESAVAEPVNAHWLPLPQVDRNDASQPLANGAMPTLITAFNAAAGEVDTTIDLATQEKTLGVIRPALQAFNQNGSHAAAAAVVLDVQRAQCLAAVSVGDRPGLDLTHRRRSTGSVLKPFIYAAAFQANLAAPQSLLNDAPASWVGYQPRNFDRSFRGQIDADAALAESRNIPAMLLLAKVGVNDMTRMLASLGIDEPAMSNRTAGLTLAVGGAEASAWEIAEAYATLARGGVMRTASLTPDSLASNRQVLARPACMAVLHSLDDADRTQSICPSAALLNAAWKTGTSSGSRDAWCAAVTPRNVVVVWVGNASGSGDVALKGASIAAPIALNILASVDQGGVDRGGSEFDGPPKIIRQPISLAATKSDIAITEPIEHQKFILDPAVAADQQQIICRVSGSEALNGPVWWFVDRTFVGKSVNGYPIPWTPTPGPHTVRAVGCLGDCRPVHFQVQF